MRPFSLRVAIVVFGAAVLTTLAVPAMARADAVTQWNANANAAILACEPDRSFVGAQLRDGARSGVRRRQRHRRRLQAVPGQAGSEPVGLDRCRRRDRGVPRAPRGRPGKPDRGTCNARCAVHRRTCGRARRRREGRWHRSRRSSGSCHARSTHERRPQSDHAVPVRLRDDARRVAGDPAADDARAHAVGRQREAVPRPRRRDAPHEGAERSHEQEVRQGSQRGRSRSAHSRAATRTPDETSAAIFWQSPPLFLWGGLERSLSQRYGLSTADNARLFAEVSLAEADAAIGCWNDKYYWNFWRPADAIHLADTDGNPATTADPTWRPLFDPATPTVPALATPNFPDHPSGHSCVTGSTMKVLQDFFDTDGVAFDLVSTRFAGTPEATRHFDSFSAATEEVINARVWGGIHFRTADEQGVRLGEEVGRWEDAPLLQARQALRAAHPFRSCPGDCPWDMTAADASRGLSPGHDRRGGQPPKASSRMRISQTSPKPSRARIGRDIGAACVTRAGVPRATASSQRAATSAR